MKGSLGSCQSFEAAFIRQKEGTFGKILSTLDQNLMDHDQAQKSHHSELLED
ncbi:hypothetical protein Scep_024221 [Stephania cephalantha]|uniref:Uncharacterized protein n=1 Tax=Stephania cephalantha TaxID=152367 RepID=A0AAP0EW58_9MAGN